MKQFILKTKLIFSFSFSSYSALRFVEIKQRFDLLNIFRLLLEHLYIRRRRRRKEKKINVDV